MSENNGKNKQETPQRRVEDQINRAEISLLKLLIEKNPDKAKEFLRKLKAQQAQAW